MEKFFYDALKDLFLSGAVALRSPRYLSIPFNVDFEVLETDPILRELVMRLLEARVDARAYDGIAAGAEEYSSLAPIYADRCGVRFVLPKALALGKDAPIMFFGKLPRESCVLVFNVYNAPVHESQVAFHPLLKIVNALRAQGYRVARIVSLFDADRDSRFQQLLIRISGTPIVYDVIYSVGEVFRMMCVAPEDFGVTRDMIQRAREHYENNPIVAPPSRKL